MKQDPAAEDLDHAPCLPPLRARPHPDGAYITVENIGDQAGTFDSMSQKLVDADGKQYSTDSAAQISVDTDTWLNEINPGNSAEGQLIFDVPEGAKLDKLQLQDFISFDEPAEVDISTA